MDLTPSQHQLLEKYVDAVMQAPGGLGLTAASTPDEFRNRHVLDAVALLHALPPSLLKGVPRIVDIGSGNGVPGIVIAVMFPEWPVTMIDSGNNKCGFIDMFCKYNAINNAFIACGRAEDLAREPKLRAQFDIAFARALGKLPYAIEICVPFLKLDGSLVIPHGSSHASELDRSNLALKELGSSVEDILQYDANETTFSAIIIKKDHETSDRYPRRHGIPNKRPL